MTHLTHLLPRSTNHVAPLFRVLPPHAGSPITFLQRGHLFGSLVHVFCVLFALPNSQVLRFEDCAFERNIVAIVASFQGLVRRFLPGIRVSPRIALCDRFIRLNKFHRVLYILQISWTARPRGCFAFGVSFSSWYIFGNQCWTTRISALRVFNRQPFVWISWNGWSVITIEITIFRFSDVNNAYYIYPRPGSFTAYLYKRRSSALFGIWS